MKLSGNQYTKTKESIRKQVFHRLNDFSKVHRISFLTSPLSFSPHPNYSLDEGDFELIFIKINRSTQILMTAKFLFIFRKDRCIKIDGNDLDCFEYTDFNNLPENLSVASKIKKAWLKFKIARHMGAYRIIRKDQSYEEIYYANKILVYCTSDCIKTLQFISRKYLIKE